MASGAASRSPLPAFFKPCPYGSAISKAATGQQFARSVIAYSATAICALNTCNKSFIPVLARMRMLMVLLPDGRKNAK
ncbi:hypothetical protein BM221_005894 [Beauveria bassiana]|uniref:Uncharacterized protein n=1 Tax=Beauveria bassiana TaxID=176275 RepID=A0A2N6NKG2_BEABA|nr:hypothetical protein BM221_005894 [Beauveria bassiana]